MKTGGTPSGLLGEVWPWIEDLLMQLFEIHTPKTHEGEYLVFNLTQKKSDKSLYIVPGAVETETGIFRNIEIYLDGEATKIIPLDKPTLTYLIENANKQGKKPKKKQLEKAQQAPDEPFQNLDL